jgi:hypothetical protein
MQEIIQLLPALAKDPMLQLTLVCIIAISSLLKLATHAISALSSKKPKDRE